MFPNINFGVLMQSIDHHRIGVADAEIMPSSRPDPGGEADSEMKYVKRSNALRRTLLRFFPSFFKPTLPVTTKYGGNPPS